MKEYIYSISDIEMGRGDITDDFSDDQAVADFLEKIIADHSDEHPTPKITLVLNGDIFDFLKMEYKGELPDLITEEISLWKLEETIKTHTAVFAAMKKFLAAHEQTFIHFVIGNHDADLAWPSLQTRIKQELGNHDRINFDYWYKNGPIHAEHGHLQDPVFMHRTHRPIITHKKKEILNLPWGAYVCFSDLVQFKKKYPKEEQLFPHTDAIATNKQYERDGRKMLFSAAAKLLLKRITNPRNPNYRIPYFTLLKHISKHGFEFVDDHKLIKSRIKKITKTHPDKQVLLLGHAHLFNKVQRGDQTILITDTWRNEYDLTNNGEKKPKTYARIAMENGTIQSADIHTFTQ